MSRGTAVTASTILSPRPRRRRPKRCFAVDSSYSTAGCIGTLAVRTADPSRGAGIPEELIH